MLDMNSSQFHLDVIDKKILQHLSSGIKSYDELARMCEVSRNTIYRRIAALENEGIIKNTIKCEVNMDKIEISPVIIGVKISTVDEDRALNLLATHKNVKLLWRTYGDYNISLVAFSQKGSEGIVIESIKTILEDLDPTDMCISVGFVWEKTDFTPVENQSEMSIAIDQMLEKRH